MSYLCKINIGTEEMYVQITSFDLDMIHKDLLGKLEWTYPVLTPTGKIINADTIGEIHVVGIIENNKEDNYVARRSF